MDSGVDGSEWLQSGSEWHCYLSEDVAEINTAFTKQADVCSLDFANYIIIAIIQN